MRKEMVQILMTDSSHSSKVLLIWSFLLFVQLFVLPAAGQTSAWILPGEKETLAVYSLGGGTSSARETYLSESTYSGWSVAAVTDSWTGRSGESFMEYRRVHSDILFSSMTNWLGGGSTWQVMGNYSYSLERQVVKSTASDLLLGPVAMINIGCLYNRANSNNPATAEGYLALGLCADYTYRYSIRRYPMVFQTSLYVPLAGVGFAPDYDQPYWHMYHYNQYGRALHVVWPGNNHVVRGQIALVLPVFDGRLRVGADLDYYHNRLGGHLRRITHTQVELGYVFTFEHKAWRL